MKALVLEKKNEINIRDIEIDETMGVNDVRIRVHTVGICGSDVHFYQHGEIGPFVVREPMVLGHEAAGIVIETGENVKHLKPGDEVCMEPGVPDLNSQAVRLGIYNLDPALTFWATPPNHGCLRETLVHPASFTYKLPANITPAEAALVEPLAVGIHAVNKARVKPGDVAVVLGAGTIGLLAAAAALAGGCSKVIISDIVGERLEMAKNIGSVVPVNVSEQNLLEIVQKETAGWGADIVFEASGVKQVAASVFDFLCPGGVVVFIGLPCEPVPMELVNAATKEARMETVFRYANVYPRSLALMGSGKIDVKPFITESFPFADAVKAFDYACKPKPSSVKVQIVMEGAE